MLVIVYKYVCSLLVFVERNNVLNRDTFVPNIISTKLRSVQVHKLIVRLCIVSDIDILLSFRWYDLQLCVLSSWNYYLSEIADSLEWNLFVVLFD